MFIKNCGYDTPHEKGAFGIRGFRPHYFISCFSTPFVYEVDNELHYGNAGDFLFMPANTSIYHGPQSKEESFINDWLYVSGDDFYALLEKYPLPEKQAIAIDDGGTFKNCLRKISKEFVLKSIGHEELMTAYVTEAIVNIYRSYRRQHQTDASLLRIEAARETILLNLEKDWSLEEMAKLSGYSVSRFAALYTQHFGLSPKADLIQNRIQLAKQLLNYAGCSITEVAMQCGFQSIHYFSKYFKETVGLSPKEYAKRCNS